jgi:hypothetical protein
VADPVSRSAARLAALIAVPVAMLAGAGTLALLSGPLGADPAAEPTPAPTTTAPAPVPTGPVELPAPSLTERAELVCRALVSQLPDDLDGLVQRPVTAGPEQNAAYGEPPITIACGAPPAEYRPTDQVHPWAGVCWHAVEEPDASVWTALAREVPVQVRVPASYDGPFQHVLAFSVVIAATVPSAGTAPAGCQPAAS